MENAEELIRQIQQIQEASGINAGVDTEMLFSITKKIEEERERTHNICYNFSNEEIAVIYLHEKFGLPYSISIILGIRVGNIYKFKRKFLKEDIQANMEKLNIFLLNNKDEEFKKQYLSALQEFLKKNESFHPIPYIQITLFNLLMKKTNKNFKLKYNRYGISDVTSRRIQKDIKKVLKWT